MNRMLSVKCCLLSLLLMVFLLGLNASAQSKPEVLTNAKIIELVRLGFSERLIVEKINQSECQCDTTSEGMQKLKAAKVSEEIIMAMMNATRGYSDSGPSKSTKNKDKENDSPSSKNSFDSAGPKELRQISEPGIYLFERGKMTAIEPTVFSGTNASGWKSAMTMGIKKIKVKAKIRGRSSNLHTTETQPVFYFVFNPEYRNSGATMAGLWGVATSPAEFMLVQLDVQENSRQAVIGEARVFTSNISTGARDKDIREYSYEKIKPGTYKVVPKGALTTGEYAFYYAAEIAGVFGGGKVFDFGVK